MPVFQQSYTYRDAKGQTARVNIYVRGADAGAAATGAEAIGDAMNALTVAALQSVKGPWSAKNPTTYGTDAPFADCSDKLMVSFAAADGSIHRYRVPAPNLTVLLADEITADPANDAVVAFAAAMVAHGGTIGGAALSSFLSGLRRQGPQARRLNSLLKNPALTGPAW